MGDREAYGRTPAPASEEIHLPGPSALPLLTAVSITLIVVGLGLTLIISAVGAVLFIWCLVKWIASTRRELAELPETDA